MKTIDVNGKKYIIVREVYGATSAIGSAFAFESVVIPFTVWVFGNRPILRRLSTFGAITLGTGVALAGGMLGKEILNSYVGLYNFIADKINEKKARKNVKFKTEVNRPDKDILNDLVEETKMFEFDSEAEAKSAFVACRGCISAYGYLDLATYYKVIKNKPLPENGKYLELLQMNGWTSEDMAKWFVEEGAEGVWIFGGVTNYHDISSQFKVIKESDLNAIKE